MGAMREIVVGATAAALGAVGATIVHTEIRPFYGESIRIVGATPTDIRASELRRSLALRGASVEDYRPDGHVPPEDGEIRHSTKNRSIAVDIHNLYPELVGDYKIVHDPGFAEDHTDVIFSKASQ